MALKRRPSPSCVPAMGSRGAPLCAAQPAVRAAGHEREAGDWGPADGPGPSPGRRGHWQGARRPLGAGPGAERGWLRASRWGGGGAGNEALPGWKNTLRCRFVPSARNFVE